MSVSIIRIKCKLCDKLFGNHSRLKNHIKYYHENPDRFRCEICGKKFAQLSNFRRHQKVHDPNRSKDLKCTQCDFATDNKIYFKTHLNSHERKNAELAAMENPHKCSKCPSVLRNEKSLRNHMIVVHSKVLYECDICGKQSKYRNNMLSHLKGFHKIGSDTKT